MRDLRPRDMIDIQSFIWVQGSDEYKSEHRREPGSGIRDPGSAVRGPRSMYRPSAIGIVEKREIQEKESPAP